MARRFDVRGSKEPFVQEATLSSKKNADKVADKLRTQGKLARVLPKKEGWQIVTNPNRLPKELKRNTSTNPIPKPRIDPRTSSSTYNQEMVSASRRAKVANDVTEEDYDSIRRFSFLVGTVHLLSGLAMILWANQDFVITVLSTFAPGPPGCYENGECSPVIVSNYEAVIAYWIASFSLLSALFHYLTVLPGVFEVYKGQLERGINIFRWVEYALSSTIMILIIMLLSGLTNLSALIGVAGANVGMILFGWLSEVQNPPGRDKTDWTPFIMGCIVGSFPWIAVYGSIFLNLSQIGADFSEVPDFVWFIIVTQFLLFQSFAINHALQYTEGVYPNYLFGERIYIWLSLISKSLLAWSIWANTAVLG